MATGAFSDMVLYLQNTINLILDKIGRSNNWSNNFIKFPDNKEAENPEWICVPNPSCAVVRKDGGLFVFKSEDSCFPARLKCVSPYRTMKAYKLQKASLLPPIYHGHVTGHVITSNLCWFSRLMLNLASLLLNFMCRSFGYLHCICGKQGMHDREVFRFMCRVSQKRPS